MPIRLMEAASQCDATLKLFMSAMEMMMHVSLQLSLSLPAVLSATHCRFLDGFDSLESLGLTQFSLTLIHIDHQILNQKLGIRGSRAPT